MLQLRAVVSRQPAHAHQTFGIETTYYERMLQTLSDGLEREIAFIFLRHSKLKRMLGEPLEPQGLVSRCVTRPEPAERP